MILTINLTYFLRKKSELISKTNLLHHHYKLKDTHCLLILNCKHFQSYLSCKVQCEKTTRYIAAETCQKSKNVGPVCILPPVWLQYTGSVSIPEIRFYSTLNKREFDKYLYLKRNE